MFGGFLKFLIAQGNIYLIIIALMAGGIFYGLRYYFKSNNKEMLSLKEIESLRKEIISIERNINVSMNNLSDDLVKMKSNNNFVFHGIKNDLEDIEDIKNDISKIWEDYHVKLSEIEMRQSSIIEKLNTNTALLNDVRDEMKETKHKLELIMLQMDNNNSRLNQGL